jgi:hypothetical protein
MRILSFPMPPFVDRARARRLGAAGGLEEIWGLHSILADPGAAPAEARRARTKMLKILEKNRTSARLRMIVPPLVVPPPSPENGSLECQDRAGRMVGIPVEPS